MAPANHDLFHKCKTFKRARELQAAGLYPYFKALASAPGTEVVIGGRKVVMIGSNNYLGLTNHPHVKEAAIKAVEKYGTSCTGSRFLNGTLDLHEELEHRLAAFLKKEAAVVFSTGFQTNLGTIASLVGKDDTAVIDRQDHASIIDGCRLSFGHTAKYRHNDMEELERVLQGLDGAGNVLIVVDGVFSMEGDLANLPKIVALKKKYNARLMVDDAHGIGVMGANGRGTSEHFGVEDDVDLVMGTFSKSFASLGGVIAGPESVIHYIKHASRSLIFSASMPPSAVATVLAALDVILMEPERRQRLWSNTRKIMEGFKKIGLNTGPTCSPVVPIIVGDQERTFTYWRLLFDNGLFTNPIVPPGVAPENSLIRTSYMATHTSEELDRVLDVVGRTAREFELVTPPRRAGREARAAKR